MFKRTVTGAIYVAVLTAFFLLRQFVDARLFHILTCFLLVGGTVEVVNALKDFIPKNIRLLAILGATLLLPIYLISEYFCF